MTALTLNQNLYNALNQISQREELCVDQYDIDIDEEYPYLGEKEAIIFGAVSVTEAGLFSTFVASNSVLTTGSIAWKTVALSGVVSFGATAVFTAGLYFGYNYVLKCYKEDETHRKAQDSIKRSNHEKILKQIREEIEKIQTMQRQLDSAGEISINEIPVNYRENECPIDLLPLIENNSSDQRPLEKLPCGHVLHQDCYNSLIRSGSDKCPFDRKPLFPKIPKIPIIPVPIPKYEKRSFEAYIKNKISSALKITKDIAKLVTVISTYISGCILIGVGAGTMILWIPTFVPTLLIISAITQDLVWIKCIASVLGLASVVSVGGLALCAISVKLGKDTSDDD